MSKRLVPDLGLPWEDEMPYTVLAEYGAGPQLTADQVMDLSFDLDLSDGRLNVAWESLRQVRRRLVVDFFCYDAPEEAIPEPLRPDQGSPPMPWSFIRQLLDELPPEETPDSSQAQEAETVEPPASLAPRAWWQPALGREPNGGEAP